MTPIQKRINFNSPAPEFLLYNKNLKDDLSSISEEESTANKRLKVPKRTINMLQPSLLRNFNANNKENVTENIMQEEFKNPISQDFKSLLHNSNSQKTIDPKSLNFFNLQSKTSNQEKSYKSPFLFNSNSNGGSLFPQNPPGTFNLPFVFNSFNRQSLQSKVNHF